MKKKFDTLIPVLLILILGIGSNNLVCGQDTQPDAINAKIIGLDKGCKLVLDSTIDIKDTVSIQIVNGIHNILPRILELIPVDSVIIKLSINSKNILPVWGVGGRTTSVSTDQHRVETVELYYDPNHSNFRVEFILRSLVHELHHAYRIRMPQFQLTLLECMVNEGLADHFMVEVLNCEQTPWSSALTEEQIRQNMIRVKPLLRIKHKS